MRPLRARGRGKERFGKGPALTFSDGVIAIIITIMVLELKVPHGPSSRRCAPLVPVFLSYVLSFIYVGIYWNNHHHLLPPRCSASTAAMLWANLHLLFWLSLVPFATGWMGENHFAPLPTALYGVVLLMAAIAYGFCNRPSSAATGADSPLARGRRPRLQGQAVAAALRARRSAWRSSTPMDRRRDSTCWWR